MESTESTEVEQSQETTETEGAFQEEPTTLENDFQEESQETTDNTISDGEDYTIPTDEADDEDFDFDNMTEEELDNFLSTYDTEEELDGFKLPDKFKDTDALLQSYNALEAKMGNFIKAPDEYNIEGVDMADPMISELASTAKELNMSNDAFTAIVSKHAEVQKQMDQIAMEQEMHNLGDHAAQRIESINTYIDANIAPHLQDAVRNMATTSESIQALESLIQQARPSTPAMSPQTQSVSSDPKDMMWAKDSNGNLKMESDPEYAKMVTARMEAYYN